MSAMRAGPIAPLPTLAQAPSPSAGNQRAPASAGQRLAKSAPQASGRTEIDQRREAIGADARRLEHLGVPDHRVDVEETGSGRHADGGGAGVILAEPAQGVLGKREPAARAVKRVRIGSPQPAQLGRPVGRMEATAGPLPDGVRVELRTKRGRLMRGAGVGPIEDRGGRRARGVDPHQAMPERGAADGRDAERPRRRGARRRRRWPARSDRTTRSAGKVAPPSGVVSSA